MRIARRSSALLLPWLIAGCVAALSFGVLTTAAQTPASAPAATANLSATNSAPAGIQGVINLTGPWRFQMGDDPRWADPSFDDSSWPVVALDEPLTSQGVEPYSGYGWYRIRFEPKQLAAFDNLSSTTPLDLLISGTSVGQLAAYVDGVEAGHTRGMTDHPAMFQSPPFSARLSGPGSNGSRVLAIRTWAGPGIPIRRGLLARVELGTHDDIADRLVMATGRQWNEQVTSAIIVAFLFLCVAGLGTALYLAQRHHAEYLWLALLCVAVAARGAADAAFGLAWMPLPVYQTFKIFAGHIFIAVTLEFVLHFTSSPHRRFVRGLQIAVLLIPFISLLHFDQLFEALSISAELAFCATVCVLLFQAWRRGAREAGVMLLPFFLASAWDSIQTVLEYAAYKRWIPERFAPHPYNLGPIVFSAGTLAFIIFLASLVAVILYRFIRVSQDEQRSNAEISAARSVQALLIPTHLPSTRNFMLESAYLPVNGVGGDFFQVLPLKDDSLLIVVGDVSGKGLQAAMNSSTLVGALRNELSHDPATVLAHLNRVLLGAVSSPGAVPELDAAPCFATCLCARIYPDGTLAIANAGHLSPYRDGRELELIPGLPLGVIAEAEYEESTFQLDRGDRLIFLSDGVVEATNQQGELFGFERTQQVSIESARYIAQTAQRFGQTDDITVVSLYVASRAAERAGRETLQTR
jgi:phosphoserine phosphatase RsbU/P